MKITLELEAETYIIGKNLHRIKIAIDGNQIQQITLNLDQIEDLEGNLTDLIMQLTSYRRILQREELELN